MNSAASIEAQFDPSWYLRTYPDVAAAGVDPLQHWRQYGSSEGRGINSAHPGVFGTSDRNTTASFAPADPAARGMDRFDPAFYLTANPDVAKSGMDPLSHSVKYGYNEGRGMNAGEGTQSLPAGMPPMLKPNDPNSWAGWQMQAHAQTAGLNNMPNMAPSTATLLGMDPQAVSAMYRKAVANLGMGS